MAIPAIVWVTLQGGYYFFAFVTAASTLALLEFYGLAAAKGASPQRMTGLVFGFLVNLAFIYERVQIEVYEFMLEAGLRLGMFSLHQFILFVLLVFLLVVALVELFRSAGSPIMNAGTTVAGVLLVPLFFGTLIGIRELFPYGFPAHKFFDVGLPGDVELARIQTWGGWTVVTVFASIWMCDTAAYFGGLSFGKHKLFTRVSPKKTWEGAAFGFLAAVGTFLLGKTLALDYLSLTHAAVLGAFVGVFGQIGDLVESRFKRDAGVKDASSILPGHGGVYDRFDSLVFLSPILYLYIDFVVLS